MPNTAAKENFTKDLGTIVLSVILALILARTGIFRDFLFASQKGEIFGNFLAGTFFTSIFTVAPATVVLAELADAEPLWQVAVIGGFGALLGDFIIFRFVKDRFAAHLQNYLRQRSRRHLLFFRSGMLRWLMFALGALIVASPLPDELGLAMMGLTKMKTPYFLFFSFSLNTLGILAVALVGRAI